MSSPVAPISSPRSALKKIGGSFRSLKNVTLNLSSITDEKDSSKAIVPPLSIPTSPLTSARLSHDYEHPLIIEWSKNDPIFCATIALARQDDRSVRVGELREKKEHYTWIEITLRQSKEILPPQPQSYSFHYLRYSYRNDQIILDAPDDYRVIFGRTSNGEPIHRWMFTPSRWPKSISRILRALEAESFADDRLVKLVDAKWCQIANVKEIQYVAIEKAIVPLFVLETRKEDEHKLVSRPMCYLCKRQLGYGSRCQKCAREACSVCRPHQYYPNYWRIKDEEFAVRMFVRPCCDECLPIRVPVVKEID